MPAFCGVLSLFPGGSPRETNRMKETTSQSFAPRVVDQSAAAEVHSLEVDTDGVQQQRNVEDCLHGAEPKEKVKMEDVINPRQVE